MRDKVSYRVHLSPETKLLVVNEAKKQSEQRKENISAGFIIENVMINYLKTGLTVDKNNLNFNRNHIYTAINVMVNKELKKQIVDKAKKMGLRGSHLIEYCLEQYFKEG